MNVAETIPADQYLDQVIKALASVDATELSRLGKVMPSVIAPLDRARYFHRHAVFSALLDASGRNLRLLRRVACRSGQVYVPPLVS